MKKLLALFALALTLTVGLSALTGCKASLESGGAYAQPGTQPDIAFYNVDAAYDLAYSTVDAAFKFERDNRVMLWQVSPEIKHTLDSIRPKAVDINARYLAARSVYISNPIPSGLSTLQLILAEAQKLATTAQSVLPKG